MKSIAVWIVKSKHINPDSFYVRVDGSDFYTAYWIANTLSEQQAISLVLETCDELVLGQVEIEEVIEYSGQQISSLPEVEEAIKEGKEKYVTPDDMQLAAWISSQGGMW